MRIVSRVDQLSIYRTRFAARCTLPSSKMRHAEWLTDSRASYVRLAFVLHPEVRLITFNPRFWPGRQKFSILHSIGEKPRSVFPSLRFKWEHRDAFSRNT